MEKLGAEDLSRFHAAYWKPASSALIFAGDITLADAVDLARRSFGSWSGGSAPLLAVPPPQTVGPGKVFMVDRADAAQTVVTQILPGPARSASDYYALTLADAVWGGGAGARLGTNIREEKGYSYGVFSFANANSKYGLWMASGGVQTNKTKESVVEFQKELKFIAGGKPVSEKELADARNNRIRGYAQEFESLGRVASVIQNLWNTGMPMTEIERRDRRAAKSHSRVGQLRRGEVCHARQSHAPAGRRPVQDRERRARARHRRHHHRRRRRQTETLRGRRVLPPRLERKQLFQLGLRGLTAVFADLECLGVLRRCGPSRPRISPAGRDSGRPH